MVNRRRMASKGVCKERKEVAKHLGYLNTRDTFDCTLDLAIERLQKMEAEYKEEGFTQVWMYVEHDHDWDGHPEININIQGYRPETDAEMEERIKEEELEVRRETKAAATRQKAIEERDKAEYARLKKKFGDV